MEKSGWKMHRATCLSEDDCAALSQLLQKGFSFHDALKLMVTPSNQECIQDIETAALAGGKLNEIIADKMPGSLKSYVRGFSSCMTLAESIAAAMEIHKSEEELKRKLMKELLYPMLLLAGVLAGIFLFSHTILPAMISMMSSFAQETGGLQKIQILIRFFTMFLLAFCVCLLLIAAWCLHPAHIVATMMRVSRISYSTLLNQYASILFARYFLACSRRHVSTQKALATIASLKDNPLPSAVARMMDQRLMAGEGMKKAVEHVCLEEKLIGFFRISIQAGECNAMLEGYLDMAEKRAEKQVRVFSKSMQTVCYGCIGLILILVYRILMMPMQLLKTI